MCFQALSQYCICIGSATEYKSVNESQVTQSVPSEPEECTICCDDLAKESVSALTNGKRRVCRHFFHTKCLEGLREYGHNNCPICRVAFNGAVRVPDIFTNPSEWFKFVDSEKRGSLSLQQILDVFRASLLVDYKQLEAKLPGVFTKWDINKDGRVSYKEMMAPRTGLVAYAQRFRPRQIDYSDMPDINRDKRAWFLYWDLDGNGQLDQEEVTRALTKTLFKSRRISPTEIINFREVVKTLWPEFDPVGLGQINVEEFSRYNGLYDTVIANLKFHRNVQ